MSTTTLLERFTSATGLSRRRKRRQRHQPARPRGLRLEPLERREVLSVGMPGIELLGLSGALFVENQGQWADESVRFVHHGNGANVAMTDTGPVFELSRVQYQEDSADESHSHAIEPQGYVTETLVFSASFVGAESVVPVGLEQSEVAFNYFVGDESTWQAAVASYGVVAYQDLYEGIDLHTWGLRSNLKYEFHVAPGADPAHVQVRYDGVDGLSLTDDGALEIALGGNWGSLIDAAPYIYQVIDGQEVDVDGRFVLVDELTYAFEITGEYDPDRTLVIDPEVHWSTYLGGSGEDTGWGIAIDQEDNALVVGWTLSTDFAGDRLADHPESEDAFLAKLSSQGTLEWVTYLGGSRSDRGRQIAIDTSGNALVTGQTASRDFAAAVNDPFGDSWNAFVAKVASNGQLLWASYIGGTGLDYAFGIALDVAGDPLVTGQTTSSDLALANNAYPGGYYNAFVTKLSSDGQTLWSTYIGGSGSDEGYRIALDSNGHAFVSGNTNSLDLPARNNEYHGGESDAFVAKVSVGGTLQWTTYIGGSGPGYDRGRGIALNTDNTALFVTGFTGSADLVLSNNPSYRSPDGLDGFVAKVSPEGDLQWSTYLGGVDGSTYSLGIVLDSESHAVVAGRTFSNELAGRQNEPYGTSDGFLARVSPDGQLLWSMYLGGSDYDVATDIALDSLGNGFVSGFTDSLDFVASNNDSYGGRDAFVAKIILHPADNLAPVAINDSYQVFAGSSLSVGHEEGVLANDWDPDNGPEPLTAELVSAPTHGELYFNPDGSFTYTPPPNYLGTDSFQYRAYDGDLYSIVATVTIDVEGLTFHSTDAPKAIADAQPNRARKTESVLAVSDTNAEVGALMLDVSISHSRPSDLSGYLVSPEGTSVELFNRVSPIPTSYHLSEQFFGQALDGTWTLEIWDHLRNHTGTLEAWSLTVAPLAQENLAPVAVNDSYTVSWNQTLEVAAPGVLANDSDPNGDPLTAVLDSGPSNGALTLNANGSFTYTPTTDFVGTDTFTYQASDGEFLSNLATVTIHIVNQAPVAVDDNYSTPFETPLVVATPGVLANDSDPDGDSLTVVLVTGPSSGALTLAADGSFTFSPATGFHGNVTFTYKAVDSGGLESNEATVTITVIDPTAPVEPSEPLEYTSDDTPMTIEQAHPRQGARDTISTITIAGSEVTEIGSYGQFALVLDIDHPRLGDLSAQLVSPADNSVDFVKGQVRINTPWPTDAFDDEALDGIWTLILQDHDRGGSGTLNSWSIIVTPENAEGDATGGMMVLSAEASGAPSGDLITASSGDATVQPESEAVQVDQVDASAAWQRPPVQASAVDPLMAVLGRPAPSARPGDASNPLDDRISDLLDTLLDDLLPAALPAR